MNDGHNKIMTDMSAAFDYLNNDEEDGGVWRNATNNLKGLVIPRS